MEVYVDWAGLRKLVDMQQDRQFVFIPTHKVLLTGFVDWGV